MDEKENWLFFQFFDLESLVINLIILIKRGRCRNFSYIYFAKLYDNHDLKSACSVYINAKLQPVAFIKQLLTKNGRFHSARA